MCYLLLQKGYDVYTCQKDTFMNFLLVQTSLENFQPTGNELLPNMLK